MGRGTGADKQRVPVTPATRVLPLLPPLAGPCPPEPTPSAPRSAQATTTSRADCYHCCARPQRRALTATTIIACDHNVARSRLLIPSRPRFLRPAMQNPLAVRDSIGLNRHRNIECSDIDFDVNTAPDSTRIPDAPSSALATSRARRQAGRRQCSPGGQGPTAGEAAGGPRARAQTPPRPSDRAVQGR